MLQSYAGLQVPPLSTGPREEFRIHLTGYSGTAGDSMLMNQHTDPDTGRTADGMRFTTFDNDNDRVSSNCAEDIESPWWSNRCGYASLNGVYGSTKQWHSPHWFTFANDDSALTFTEMKFRQIKVRVCVCVCVCLCVCLCVYLLLCTN